MMMMMIIIMMMMMMILLLLLLLKSKPTQIAQWLKYYAVNPHISHLCVYVCVCVCVFVCVGGGGMFHKKVAFLSQE